MQKAEVDRRVHARAPIRFDFAGGPTDVEPFRSREGGFVIGSRLDKQYHIL